MLLLPQLWFFFNQTVLKIPRDSPHKSDFLAFWKFKFKSFLKKIEIFINMGPNGSGNFKTLLLLQLSFFLDQTFSKCSLWQSSQVTYRNFENLNLKKKRLKFNIVANGKM